MAHLHVLGQDTSRWQEQIAFRDALRADPTLHDSYARLKHRLAEAHPADREAYTDGKEDFIRRVLNDGKARPPLRSWSPNGV